MNGGDVTRGRDPARTSANDAIEVRSQEYLGEHPDPVIDRVQ